MPDRRSLVLILLLAATAHRAFAGADDSPADGSGGKPTTVGGAAGTGSGSEMTNWLMPFSGDGTGTPAPPPEPPAQPLPEGGQRDQAGSRAQQGEEQLGTLPAPNPALSDRVANEYLRAGQPDGAERVLGRLIDSGDAGPDAYRLRAAARFQQEDWAGAYSDAQAALSRDPDDKVAADLAGTARMELKRLGLDAPEVKPGGAGRGPERPPAGESAPAGDDPRWVGSGIPVQLSGPPGYVDPRKAFMADIDRKASIGGRREAVLDLTRYLDKHPDDLGVVLKRAHILNLDKNPGAALSDVKKVLAVFPSDPATLREGAYSLIELGRAREALPVLERAVRLQPRNALGYLYRAMARRALGDWDGALADYALPARLDPALRGAYDDALAASGRGAKPGGAWSAARERRVRLGTWVMGLPLLLVGLWGGVRRLSGRGTRAPAPGPDAPAAPGPGETLSADALLGGVYRIGRVLGRGGMGVVFEAEDLALERKVAIKQLRAPEGSAADFERFLGEARLVAKLQHPNIVQIHTVLEEGGLLYLVFELVDGRGLDSVLAERGRLSAEETRLVLRDVCAALDCAHEARIIHRDLKPSNVMRTAKGVHKVMDFGIAHQARGEALTRTGAWGTPPYMAPEQERGMVSKESDLYALGCTAYELLAGVRPFGPSGDKLTPRFTPVVALAPGLPAALDAFFARALDPDPARRFHSGAELSAAYDACFTGRPAAAPAV